MYKRIYWILLRLVDDRRLVVRILCLARRCVRDFAEI
jgi:hypothetical protein